MVSYDLEKNLIGYCGVYCRNCDYYSNVLGNSAENLLFLIEKHNELKAIAETDFSFGAEEFSFNDFLKD